MTGAVLSGIVYQFAKVLYSQQASSEVQMSRLIGKTAEVATLAKYPGYAEVKSGKQTWLMKPVASSTGAIRLEDLKGQFLVIQIANKSMLFDSKSGQRVLDGCMNAAQKDVTDKLKTAEAGK